MKFVVFGDAGRLGLIDGDRILDLAAAADSLGDTAAAAAFSSLLALIEAGDKGLDLVRSVADKSRGAGKAELYTDLAGAKLQAPWPGQRLLMAGANFAEHVASCFTNMGTPMTAEQVHANTRKGKPSGFWAFARPVMGPDASIEIPGRAGDYFDYEGEPAVVLGRRGKDIKAKDFAAYVWGVTMVIDWSAREPVWPPRAMDPFAFAKNFDCSKSIGPCIVVGEGPIEDVEIETLVNGQRRQLHKTSDMIFSFGEVVEHISEDFTFYPGDVIGGGTGPGTAIDQTVPNADGSWPIDKFLKPGDTVEVRSPQIGSLVGHIVPKS